MSTVADCRSGNRFTDRVFDLLEIVDYRPAVTDEDRDAVFRLRYQAYQREHAIKPDFFAASERSIRRSRQHVDIRRLR